MIERNKYEAEFGPNHPTVKALDAELETMKNELKSLVERETSRIVELMSSTNQDSVDPTTRAQGGGRRGRASGRNTSWFA